MQMMRANFRYAKGGYDGVEGLEDVIQHVFEHCEVRIKLGHLAHATGEQ